MIVGSRWNRRREGLSPCCRQRENLFCQRAACNASGRAQCTGTVCIIAPSHSEGSACLNIGAPDRYPFVPGRYVTQQFLHGALGISSTNRQHLIDNLLDTAKAEHIVQKQLDVLVCQQSSFVPEMMGQLTATEMDMGVAFLQGCFIDLFAQVFLLSKLLCNLLLNMIRYRLPQMPMSPASGGRAILGK